MRITIESDEQARLAAAPAAPSQAAEAVRDGGVPANVHSTLPLTLYEGAVAMNGGGAPSHSLMRRRVQQFKTAEALDAGGPPSHLIEAARDVGNQEVSSHEGGVAPKVDTPPRKKSR